MPSDPSRVRLALDALAGPIAEFRAAIAGALGQAEAVLAEATAGPDTRTARAQVELGAFAAGRIDPQAFADRFARVSPVGPAATAALVRSVSILREVVVRGEELFVVEVPPGGELTATVGTALEQVGRAFGAIQLAELVRAGRYQAEEPDLLLAGGFRHWSRAARRCMPPLVVSLAGEDLHATALTDFCDGSAKLLLVVQGLCAPAPLVRLITPGTFVLQTTDRAGLDRFAAQQGPAVAALLPQGTARFLHDPAGGRESWQRLSVVELPEPPRRAVGGQSAWQQAEDLEQLVALARTPFSIPGAAAPAAPALGESEAVDRLASWLLGQHNPQES